MTTTLKRLSNKGCVLQEGGAIYSSKKEGRGNGFRIFSDGKLELWGRVSRNNEITIPTAMLKWVKLAKPLFRVLAQYKLRENKIEFLTDYVRIRKSLYGAYIQFSKSHLFDPGVVLQCVLNLGTNLLPTKYYREALKLLSIPLPPVTALEPVISGGKGKRTFKLYRVENYLYLQVRGILKEGYSLYLSGELAYHIQDWFRSQLVLASIDGGDPLILETRTIRQHSKRKLEKCLYFPYSNAREAITVTFTSPTYRLSTNTLKDLEVKQLLATQGVPIQTFKSNNVMSGTHYDYSFEVFVRTIARQQALKQNWRYFPEVLLQFNLPDENIQGNSKIVDIILVEKREQKILLVELKTSKNPLGSSLEEAIAAILHLKNKFKQQQAAVFPVLFINQDLTRLANRLILTEQYGLSCGVLLFGPHRTLKLHSFAELAQTFVAFVEKQRLLKKNKAHLIHPITGEVTTTKQLQEEALNQITHRSLPNSTQNVAHYALLMGLTITDFWRLYTHFKHQRKQDTQKVSIKLGSFPRKASTLHPAIIQVLHAFLVERDYFGLLELEYQRTNNASISVLLQHKHLLLTCLPASLKIHGIRKREKGLGVSYEQAIYSRLIAQGYQVASNILCTHLTKPFEIDHLAFKENKMIIVSCKDRSTISHESDLQQLIQEAANMIEYRKNLLGAEKGILYVKVAPQFHKRQQTLFGTSPWVKDVEIIID
ncbi:MAG: hypothetical protein ACTSXA_08760 [Candidatus Heimdallarchaeota archaeon]